MSVNIVKNKPKIYGLTGGIASGKSTAANFFIENNIKVFDSDLAVKHIWQDNETLRNIILEKYNIDILSKTGKSELSTLLFNNKEIKKEVESLIHPLVLQMVEDFKEENKLEDILIIDMPLLFEIDYQKNVDKTILIYVNRAKQINRLVIRDSISYNTASNKIANQMDLENKKALANYVIDNNGDKETLYQQLKQLLEEIKDENK